MIKIVRDPALIQVTDSDNENNCKAPQIKSFKMATTERSANHGGPSEPHAHEASPARSKFVHFADTQKQGSTRTGFLRFNQTPEAFGEMPGEEPQHK